MLLLRSEWAGAVNRILAPHPADTREVAAAKEAYFTGEAGEGGEDGRGGGGSVSEALRCVPALAGWGAGAAVVCGWEVSLRRKTLVQ